MLFLIVLFAALIALYFWPIPKRSFEKLSPKVAKDSSQSLLDFRKNNPLKTININNFAWNYISLGEATETILFLHGMTGAYDIWWQQIEALKSDYRIISVSYPAVDSLEELSQGVLQILQAENIAKVKVLGSSLGGYLAQYLLAKYPQIITQAVFANSFPPNQIIIQKNKKLGALLPYLPPWLILKTLRKNFHEKVYPSSANDELTLAYMLEQSYGRMSKAQVIGRFRAVVEYFAPSTEPNIPIMIIEADNDPLVEEQLREKIKKTYPTAIVHTMHDVGHFPYLNRAEEYTSYLKDFFAAN